MSGSPTTPDDAERRHALSRHAALKTRADGDVLVLPEQAIRLAGSGGEILRLALAGLGLAQIVATLRQRYPEAEALEGEVERFLAEMRALGGLVASDEAAAPAEVTPTTALTPAPTGDPVGANAAAPQHTRESTPLNLIAELTYRCPLQCPYCSNPIGFREYRDALSSDDWGRVFEQAAALGVVHVGLTGGEPSARRDLEQILERAVAADLYPHLVTAGLPLDAERLAGLAERGLRSVQISLQDATPEASDAIAGTRSFEAKLALCERTRELGLALTLNCVLHRRNLASVGALIELAERFDADRLELANTQYHGWALRNRAALMPSREQLQTASGVVREARARHAERGGGPALLFVLPDHHAERPKPCMGGWGRLAMVVDPTGRLLPCHEAGELPGLDFWNVRDRTVAECWNEAPGMQTYRGFDWMPEPCRSCPEREVDFGGCRCQAFRLLGDASLTDPACALSPHHDRVVAARSERAETFAPRR